MAKRFTNKKIKINRSYGWKPSTKKPLNFYEPPHMALLPTSVDLTPNCPPVYDQGSLGSCTAHAAAALAEYLMKVQNLPIWVPSRLALYYWNRLQEGTIHVDSGASLHEAINSMVLYGVPHESLWPYDITKFAIKPPKAVWSDAYWHEIKQGLSVAQNLNVIKTRLAEHLPIIIGFTVYESFESDAVAATGIMPMPQPNEEILGGHAVMVVGYNDSTQKFKVRNSWGKNWGDHGYFYMPYDFLLNPDYAEDFWTANTFIRFKK